MSNEQKPSENALDVVDEIEVALTLSLKVLPSESQREAVARLIDRERREARADAFEEAAEMCRDGLDCEWLKAEAAKERAK